MYSQLNDFIDFLKKFLKIFNSHIFGFALCMYYLQYMMTFVFCPFTEFHPCQFPSQQSVYDRGLCYARKCHLSITITITEIRGSVTVEQPQGMVR